MKNLVLIVLLTLGFTSCKKSVLKTYPNLVGNWHWVNWCVVESFDSKSLTVNSNGKGEFTNYAYITGGETYTGKVKTKNDELYVDGKYVFTIIEIVDTSGYIHNPNPPSLCSNDSIYVTGLLRVNTESGIQQTYWKN